MSDQFGFIRSKDAGPLRTDVITKSSRSTTPESDSSLGYIENGIREILDIQRELLQKLDSLGSVGAKLETEHTDSEGEGEEEAGYNLSIEQRQELQDILLGNHEAQDHETTDDSTDAGGNETGPDDGKT